MGLRIALFGQAAFGRDVLVRLLEAGHEIAAVYTPPEGARPDPLAQEAEARGLPTRRHRYFRRRVRNPAAGAPEFEAIPRILREYRQLSVELNVLAYVTAILPPEIVELPPQGSLCFHPSLLPRFRGGSALAWQIILGERESGVTVFRPDAGVDTGPIVVQKGGVRIEPTDTAGSLYFEKLYPLGVEALVEAAAAVAEGRAEGRPQDESQASFQGLVGERESRIDWQRPAPELDRLIRGCDPQPGAWALRGGERVFLFGGRLLPGAPPSEPPGSLLGLEQGRLLLAARGGRIAVERIRLGSGRKLPAAESGLGSGERLA